MTRALLLVAHGTRAAAGAAVSRRLAAEVACRLPDTVVRLAFCDVSGPFVGQVMPELQKYSEVIVVPVFLAPGYHVRIDLPEQLEAAGMADRARVTPALGAHPRLVASAEDRLREAGWRPGDTTVLAAAGSRDPEAGGAVRAAARALGRRLGCPVRVGYLTSAEPRVSALVEELRTDGRRVAAASWLLAPGVFQGWLDGAGADVTAAPLGVHAGVVDAVVTRYRAELRRPLHGDPEVA